jgi:hypothetical protein
MPTSSGKMQLQDFDQELVDQGFDGIDPARRTRWVNYGYNRVASEFPWLWERATATPTIAVGEFSVDYVTDIPNFRSLDYIYVTTVGSQRQLMGLDDQVFYEQWMVMDLASSSSRGKPSWYFVESDQIYILAPPDTAQTLKVLYHQRLPQLVSPIDAPVTPQYCDEAILLATMSVAHKRTYELQLAAQMEADLGDWIDQMKIDEEWQDENKLQRTRPDDTWL